MNVQNKSFRNHPKRLAWLTNDCLFGRYDDAYTSLDIQADWIEFGSKWSMKKSAFCRKIVIFAKILTLLILIDTIDAIFGFKRCLSAFVAFH